MRGRRNRRARGPEPRGTDRDDELAALGWAVEHAADLGSQSGQLIVAGGGTGGARAAWIAVRAHAAGWPQLRRQILVYPTFTQTCPMPSLLTGVAPATVISSDTRIDPDASIGEELARLQRAPGDDVLVLGSATLVQCLLRRAMIDELVLQVQPVIKGRGRRLFDEFTKQVPMRQITCVTFSSGVVSLSYEMNVRGPSGPDEQTRRPGTHAQEGTTMKTTANRTTRELDHRINDGLDVKLLWDSLTDRVSVAVEDGRTGECFELNVDPGDAVIAFHHPYAYASRGRTDHALAA